MARFDGKVAVVTGAGQGLGFAVAKAFVDEGAKVVLTGRTLSKLENAVEKIGSKNAVAFHMDVGVEEDWKRLVAFIKEKYGEMDYLVNNAAIIKIKNILEITFEEFKEYEHCNQHSVFLGMKYCYEVLKKGCYSAIVNVSSVGGLKAGPGSGNDAGYHATKAAVRNLTKHAAVIFGPDCIRVNSVHPSGINTEMRKAAQKINPTPVEVLKATKALPPYVSEPEEVAAVVLFCCDPVAKTMTGAEITIDCGFMAQ
ncbi:MAG: SDR family oxidoreductase [Clostridiales bacterium]|nr:SDR family oxidoreductase [Clostridiales bacterium]